MLGYDLGNTGISEQAEGNAKHRPAKSLVSRLLTGVVTIDVTNNWMHHGITEFPAFHCSNNCFGVTTCINIHTQTATFI